MLLHSLAVMNQTFFKEAFGKNLNEIMELKKKPSNTEKILSIIFESNDVVKIKESCTNLMNGIRSILLDAQQQAQNEFTVSQVFTSYYPEIKEQINKILSACDRKDVIAAASACKNIQKELAQFLATAFEQKDFSGFNIYSEYNATYDSFGLPNIVSYVDKSNFGILREKVSEFDVKIRTMLSDNSVPLNIVESKGELDMNFWHRD